MSEVMIEWSEVELVSTSFGDNDSFESSSVLTPIFLVLEIFGFSVVEDKEGSLGRVVEGTDEASN